MAMMVVAPASEVTPGTSHLYEVDGVQVLLMQVDGEIRATAGLCTHAATLLGPFELLDDGLIECPSHGAVFDSSDGQLIEGPKCPALPVYPAEVDEQGMVRVALPAPEEQAPAEQDPFGGARSMSAWFANPGATPDQGS